MSSPSAEVLIAGAGPAGLVLALTLLHNGIPVRIIDKLTTPRVGIKGAGIQPRSLEVYKFLDVLSDILWEGRYYPHMRMYKLPGGTEPVKTWFAVEPSAPKPPTPYLNGILLGQDHLESILRRHLERRGCHVEMGTELLDFEQDSDNVVARIVKKVDGNDVLETVKVKFLVGTDGAKGIVRKHLDLKFLCETRDGTHMMIGDIRVEGLDTDHWHMWVNEKDERVLLRPSENFDNLFTFIGGGHIDYAKLANDPNALIEWIQSVTQRRDLKFGEFTWVSDYRPNIRVVDTFGKGRVFVAGDAAHVHSPTGGQGMNSSIQDSFNLGWKLALVCKGLSPLQLLSTYSEERLPIIEEMLQVTTKILDKTMTRSSDQTSAWHRGGVLLQLGVNYRWSSIVFDERVSVKEVAEKAQHAYGSALGQGEAEVVRAGDRAPDAPGLVSRFPGSSRDHPSSLFQIFRPTFHTALIFTRYPEKAAAIARFLQQKLPLGSAHSVAIVPGASSYGPHAPHAQFEAVDDAFMDVDGYAYAHYGIGSEETIVLVRPDAVVGAVVFDTKGLERYFGNIFV